LRLETINVDDLTKNVLDDFECQSTPTKAFAASELGRVVSREALTLEVEPADTSAGKIRKAVEEERVSLEQKIEALLVKIEERAALERRRIGLEEDRLRDELRRRQQERQQAQLHKIQELVSKNINKDNIDHTLVERVTQIQMEFDNQKREIS